MLLKRKKTIMHLSTSTHVLSKRKKNVHTRILVKKRKIHTYLYKKFILLDSKTELEYISLWKEYFIKVLSWRKRWGSARVFPLAAILLGDNSKQSL